MPREDHNRFRSARLRVAAAQIDPTEADIADNLAKHFQFIDRARDHDVDILVFPELSLTGYQLKSRTPDLAITRDDERLLSIAERAGDMTVVAGFVEEGVGGGISQFGRRVTQRRGDVHSPQAESCHVWQPGRGKVLRSRTLRGRVHS